MKNNKMIAIEDINELPHWIKESEFIQSQEKDEVIYFPKKYLLPNILTNENIETVIRAILYFDNVPDNILDYFLKQDNHKLKSLVNNFDDSEQKIVEIFEIISSSNRWDLDETLASLGNIYFLDIYLEQHGEFTNKNRLVKCAILNKHSDCLQYLINKGLKADYLNIRMSILKNDLECTKILINYGLKIDNCLFFTYLREISNDNFNLELFKFMYNNMSESFKVNVVDELSKLNLIDSIKYIKEKTGILDGINAIRISIKNDYFELFKYLLDNSLTVTNTINELTFIITEYNRLEYLKYAHNKGYQFSIFLTIIAAKNGSLECLKYALENGCVYQNCALEIAIHNNQTSTVNYLLTYLENN